MVVGFLCIVQHNKACIWSNLGARRRENVHLDAKPRFNTMKS